jgi:hypothetical protein
MRWLFILLLTSFVSSSDLSAQIRSKAGVEQLLPGDWKVVNMVFNPGEPFYGTKEEKEFFDDVWQETVRALMGTTTFRFLANATYEIRSKDEKDKLKLTKGKWKIEKGGDILVMSEKKNTPDLVKVLLIDEDSMELLFEYEGGLLLAFERITPK